MIGWIIYILSNFILAASAQPSIGMCVSLVFVQTAGYMLADVMTDALIVERSRYETQETRGTMVSPADKSVYYDTTGLRLTAFLSL